MRRERPDDQAARFVTPRRLILAVWLLGLLALLLRFSARGVYEGDDINSVVPMFHLDAVRRGWLLAYRYDWQPLAYETMATLVRVGHAPDAPFIAAAVAGAVALTLLLATVWGRGETREGLAMASVALLAMPELFYSGLYYNASILGLTAASGAALVLWRGPRLPGAVAAGGMAGAAILLRLDFALLVPMLALIAWSRTRRIAAPAAMLAAILAVLLAGWLGGMLDPIAIMKLQASSGDEIRRRAAEPGWDWRTKAFVLSVALSPVGWILLVAGGPLVLRRAWRTDRREAAAWLLAALPLLVPTTALLSVKYLLPFGVVVPPLIRACGDSLLDRVSALHRPTVRTLLVALAVIPLFVSVSVHGHKPFVEPGLAPARPIGTHDGPRGYGGYVWQMMSVRSASRTARGRAVADAIGQRFRDGRDAAILVVGGEDYFDRGGAAWRLLQLDLERAGIAGRIVAPDSIAFSYRGRRLDLRRTLPAVIPARTYLIDLRDPAGR